MKKLEEKLNIEPSKIIKLEPVKEKQIEFNEDHEDDIKDDYREIRKGILTTLDKAHKMMNRIVSIVGASDELEANDKYLARNIEAFARLTKAISELNNDLLHTHDKYADVFADEEEEEEVQIAMPRKNVLFDED